MLTNSNLQYISQNYSRFGKINDQIMSGKKITKPSDDPVIAMKGMRYRSQVVEVEQFKRNLNEGFNWMDNSDAALEETGQVLQRIRELTVQASNDSYGSEERKNIAKEIERLQEHIVALANTKVGDNYIFNGTDTSKSPVNENEINMDFSHFMDELKATPSTINQSDYVISYQGQTYQYDGPNSFIVQPNIKYKDANGNEHQGPPARIEIDPTAGTIKQTRIEEQKNLNGAAIVVSNELNDFNQFVLTKNTAVSSNKQDVRIEVMKGVTIPINIDAKQVFSTDLFSSLESIKKMLNSPETKGTDITKALDSIDLMMDKVVSTRAELGAQVNRTEMVQNRLLQQEVVANKTVSDNEDIDFERVIVDLKTQESLHRASLAAGARIIQPTLMDFLR